MKPWRFMTRILILGLFIIPFYLPEHLYLRGSFDSSTLTIGSFQLSLADPFSMISQILATLSLPRDIVAGGLVVLLIYLLIRPRSFCAWVCPMNLLYETVRAVTPGKSLPQNARKNPLRVFIFFGLLALALITGFNLWAAVNPMSASLRSLQYFKDYGLLLILGLLALEAWKKDYFFCRYLCPSGTLYALLNRAGLIGIEVRNGCTGCQKCSQDCMASGDLQALIEQVREDKASSKLISMDCTLCGNCISNCPGNDIGYHIKEV